MREQMAALGRWYEDPTWVEPCAVEAETWSFTQLSSSSFRISGPRDVSGVFVADRRVRINGSIETFVASSTHSSTNTDVTVDDTTVPVTITSVEVCAVALGDSAFTALGTAGAKLVLAEDLGTAIGQATPLGTAATKDTGQGSGQVPLNSDLGSASLLDTSTLINEIPVNSQTGALGPGAYLAAAPGHLYATLSADQVVNTTAANVAITDISGLTLPGTPDGTARYRAWCRIVYQDPGVTTSTMSSPTLEYIVVYVSEDGTHTAATVSQPFYARPVIWIGGNFSGQTWTPLGQPLNTNSQLYLEFTCHFFPGATQTKLGVFCEFSSASANNKILEHATVETGLRTEVVIERLI